MEELVKAVFIFKWRSFKIFKHSGNIILHTLKKYIEFDFVNTELLNIRNHSEGKIDVTEVNDWIITMKNNKHFLQSAKHKIHYEVVTVNHTVMVLADRVSSEKLFFAKEEYWQNHISSNTLKNLAV